MKNLAICFSGAIRSFHLCHESIKKMIIDPLKKEYNVYIFGHFWTIKQDQNLSDLNYSMKWRKETAGVYQIIEEFGFTQLVIEEYNATVELAIKDGLTTSQSGQANKKLGDKILEKYNKIEDEQKRMEYQNYAVNCMGMYYKIMMANKLKNDWANNNQVKFDYVVRMRPDFLWYEKIPVNLFQNLKDNDILLVYDNYCTRAKWQGNDKFFAGTSAMMDKYTNLYNEFEYFFNNGVRIEGQELAQAMIKKLKLNIVFFGHENTYAKCAGPLHRKLERLMAKKE